MSTNYYVNTKDGLLHFGKSSSGWAFSLRVHPKRGINTLYDWILVMSSPWTTISNEYGDTVTMADLMCIVMDRDVRCPAGYVKDFCMPGEGTWNYCNYDFC